MSDARIHSWHAHVYFDSPATRTVAERLRAEVARRFKVQLGRWREEPVGPHTAPMYQIAFDVELFGTLVPWLALERGGLSVLLHPNTLSPRDDHLVHALWLGTPLPLLEAPLPRRIEPHQHEAIVPNT